MFERSREENERKTVKDLLGHCRPSRAPFTSMVCTCRAVAISCILPGLQEDSLNGAQSRDIILGSDYTLVLTLGSCCCCKVQYSQETEVRNMLSWYANHARARQPPSSVHKSDNKSADTHTLSQPSRLVVFVSSIVYLKELMVITGCLISPASHQKYECR